MTRPKFNERKILLVAEMRVETAMQVIKNAPIDLLKPIEVVVREQVKARKIDQNALMWAGALTDIANQAWVQNKKFSAEIWHEYFKREYLPEEYSEGITKGGYIKWDYTPDGERVLIGSTTQLSTGGFSDYLDQVYAYGANLGVRFSAKGEV